MGYGKGWTKFKDEFNEVFRGLTQLGYAVFFIGHHKEETLDMPDGTKRVKIHPQLSASTRTVIAGMSDIYGYAHEKYPGQNSILTLRCSDGSIECGGRFKYLPEEIPMNYKNLEKALNDAIEKEAAEHNNEFVTDERIESVVETTYDYDALMKEFQEIVGNLMNQNQQKYGPLITKIVEKYLGKGKKISETTPDQAGFVQLIITDIKEDLV